MKKKTLFALSILALISIVALAACAGGAAPAEEEAEEEPAAEEEAAEEEPAAEEEEMAEEEEAAEEEPMEEVRAASIHNTSITASLYDKTHADALGVMADEFGFTTSVSDSVEYAQTGDVARNLAADGTELIVFTSGGHASFLQEVPPEFPDTWFALISSVGELPDSGNAAGWNVDYFQAGFLVGVVGALQSESGMIGCIGGSAIPPIVANCSGVIEGAAYIDPDVVVEVDMVGDFVDAAKATEIANAMIARGVDVLFAPAGGAAQGVIQAADEAGVSGVGYIADENFRAPDTIITSQIVNFDQAYRDLGELYTSGELEATIYPMTIQGGHIHYGPFGGRVRDGVEEQAMEVFEMMLSGELEPELVIHDEIAQ